MSELKADLTFVFGEECEAYKKSEADKVIAELKHDVENWMGSYEASRRVNAISESKLRHSNYKRCLAMAERCKDKIENPVQYDEHDDWLIINEFWERWQDRWLELAEQFKEAK